MKKARVGKTRTSEIENLRRQLQEAEETLRAITSGEVDALVVSGKQGDQVYTLKDADRPYRRLVEQMNEGALTLNRQGIVLYCNTCFVKMLDLPPEQVIGQPLSQWVLGDDRSRFDELIAQGSANGVKSEIRLCNLTHEPLPAQLSVSPLNIEDELTLTAIVTDLRERKQTEESLRQAIGRLDLSMRELGSANQQLRATNGELESTQNELEAQRQRYLDLFNFAPDGYLVTDPRGVIQVANQAAAQQLNTFADRLSGIPVVAFVDLHDRGTFLSALTAFTKPNSAQIADVTVTLNPANGAPFVGAIRIGTIRDTLGKLQGLRWLIRDVTALVQAEKEVRQLNQKLERRVAERTFEFELANRLLEQEIQERTRAQNATQARNRELSVLYSLSQAAAESAGLGDMMEKMLSTILNTLEMEAGAVYILEPDEQTLTLRASHGHSPEFLPSVASQTIGEGILGRAIAVKSPAITDISEYPTARFVSALVSEGLQTLVALPVLWYDRVVGGMNLGSRSSRSFSPEELKLLASLGQAMGVWVHNARLDELTQLELVERRRAEETVEKLNRDLERRAVQLEIANQELDSFSYSVSHDLRAPLAAIDGFSKLLLTDHSAEMSDAAQRLASLIHENTQSMQQLINDLLAFSRSTRMPLTKQKVEPGEIAAQVVDELRATFGDRSVEILIEDTPACEADPNLLRQVYMNLLSNAVKFTRPRQVARIQVGYGESDDEESAYFVRDNGVGFDPENAGRLFGVFQRLHGEDEYEGTGVGLAIVERIIHRHGGRVWAEAAVDQGATFYFTLSPFDSGAQRGTM